MSSFLKGLSSSLHGSKHNNGGGGGGEGNKKQNKTSKLGASMHGAKRALDKSIHGKKQSLSSSLHGAKASLSHSLHGARRLDLSSHGRPSQRENLKAELKLVKVTLEGYKEENEELLEDAQILVEENENLQQELRASKQKCYAISDEKNALAKQLEETQFKLERCEMAYQDQKNNSFADTSAINEASSSSSNPTSRHASFTGASFLRGRRERMGSAPGPEDMLRHSMPEHDMADLGDNGPTNTSMRRRESMLSSADWHEQDLQLAINGLQTELVRKARVWQKEQHSLEMQLHKVQTEMEVMEDVAQRAVAAQNKERRTVDRLTGLVHACGACSAQNKEFLKEEKASKEQLEQLRRMSCSMPLKLDPPESSTTTSSSTSSSIVKGLGLTMSLHGLSARASLVGLGLQSSASNTTSSAAPQGTALPEALEKSRELLKHIDETFLHMDADCDEEDSVIMRRSISGEEADGDLDLYVDFPEPSPFKAKTTKSKRNEASPSQSPISTADHEFSSTATLLKCRQRANQTSASQGQSPRQSVNVSLA